MKKINIMKTALVFSVGVLAGYATCNINSNNKTEKLKAETMLKAETIVKVRGFLQMLDGFGSDRAHIYVACDAVGYEMERYIDTLKGVYNE